jgi:hypothetical protein
MAYGFTGELKHAQETFEYGITKDPEYPMFYYNLACTFAEGNDSNRALEQLRLAFKYRSNMIAGEQLPDPAKDASFRRFMKNATFLKALADLQAGSK